MTRNAILLRLPDGPAGAEARRSILSLVPKGQPVGRYLANCLLTISGGDHIQAPPSMAERAAAGGRARAAQRKP